MTTVKPSFVTPSLLVVILICTVSVFAYLFDEQMSSVLVYHHALINNGEWWRVFTGHFLHTNNYHLGLNVSALLLLWALHGKYYTVINYSLLFIFCALVTSLGLFFGSPELTQYVGLSGILHGVFVWGAVMDISHKDKTGYLLLLGVTAKIIHEQWAGPSDDIAQLINATVAIDAHLWGAIGGAVFSVMYMVYCRYILQK